jgi:phosphoserine phosphatase
MKTPRHIVHAALVSIAACLLLSGCATPRGGAASADAALSSWNADAPARSALVEYVEAVTDPASPDFIPPEERVAVFDLDGTLFCETDPNYFDYTLLVHRVAEDPDYRNRASEAERETVRKILGMNGTGVAAKGLETDHGRAVASAFAGFTLEEFDRYVQAFKAIPMPGYDGMARGDGWYRPMLQVVDYLLANGFQVWVVSGTDRFIVRAIAKGAPLQVPPERIIGSDETVVALNQHGADGLSYQLGEDDEIVLGGEFVVKNLKMNKVAAIVREVGRRPVLAFGNSTGDSSMAAWTAHGNPRRALAFMLCCDDTVRENGDPAKAERMRALCAENGWIPVSMKDDWKTIYGDGVRRRPSRAE